MRNVYIINPKAGKNNMAVRFMEKIKSFHAGESNFEIRLTQREGHGETLAREAAQQGDAVRIWAVGGDGTVLEVVRGAVGFPNAAVGIFPCGSGNDFVRVFGGREVFMNFERQRDAEAVVIDMIRSEHGDAVNLCSLGFDARVAEEMTRYKRLPGVSGELAYTISLTKCLFGRLSEHMTVRIQDANGAWETFSGDFMFSLAGNGRWYGGGYCGAPRALLNDGLLDFVLIRKPSLHRVPSLVPVYKRGEHLTSPKFSDLLIYRRGVRMEMVSEAEMVSNMDGACIRAKRETYTVLPGALRLLLPKGVALPQ